jgi:hypothetical protein
MLLEHLHQWDTFLQGIGFGVTREAKGYVNSRIRA